MTSHGKKNINVHCSIRGEEKAGSIPVPPQAIPLAQLEEKVQLSQFSEEDIYILLTMDSTCSMGEFYSSAQLAFEQISAVTRLFPNTVYVAMLLYGDYDYRKVTSFSGFKKTLKELSKFTSEHHMKGGGDHAEAQKTACNFVFRIVEQLRKKRGNDSKIIHLHLTDSPPHHKSNMSHHSGYYEDEERALKAKKEEFDWVKICQTFHDLGITTYTITNTNEFNTYSFYLLLGKTIIIPGANTNNLTKAIMGVILQSIGIEFEKKSDFKFTVFQENPVAGGKFIMESENNAQGYLPGSRNKLTQTIDFDIDPIMRVSFKGMIKKFKDKIKFQDKTLSIFKKLFVRDKVLCLTYNVVLGRLWREACKLREDERVIALQKTLSTLPAKMLLEDGKQLQTWIKDSYDATEDIMEEISKVEIKLPALIRVPGLEDMNRKDVLEISRSCSPSSFQKVLEMLSGIKVYSGDPEGLPEMYVPLGMKTRKIFGLLPHLMCPGTLFSTRPALIGAAIAYLSGNEILVDRAKKFLLNYKGRWIKLDDPLNFSPGFIKLLSKVPFALTDDEQKLFGKINYLLNLREKLNKSFTVNVGFVPTRGQIYFDIKEKCRVCKRKRSLTLLDADGTCGLCLAVPKESWPEPSSLGGANKSFLISCNQCSGLYARISLTDIDDYTGGLCHFHRISRKKTAPYYSCKRCGNKYVSEVADGEVMEKCMQCSKGRNSAIVDIQVTLRTLVEQNPQLWRYIGINPIDASSITEWSNPIKLGDIELAQFPDDEKLEMYHNGKLVLNSEELLAEILDYVQNGDTQELCCLCMDTHGVSQFTDLCGNEKCQIKVCKGCMKNWYGSVTRGNVIVQGQLCCPFCKKKPKRSVVKPYNRWLYAIIHTEFDRKYVYGWCKTCHKAQIACPKECSGENPNFGGKFECEQCVNPDPDSILIKECPGVKDGKKCGAQISKSSGCHHITCPICEEHWCFECSKKFGKEYSSDLYDHMWNDHGGIGMDELVYE